MTAVSSTGPTGPDESVPVAVAVLTAGVVRSTVTSKLTSAVSPASRSPTGTVPRPCGSVIETFVIGPGPALRTLMQ